MRRLYLSLGYASAALGVLGIALPLLPTTPFMLLAVWCFLRSDPALAERLMRHPRFGPPLADWRREGAIAPRAKLAALVAMLASYALTVWASGSLPLAVGLAVVMGGAGLYVATRPNPRRS
jgi:hypothetical protein